MTLLERIGIEILAGLVFTSGIGIWWVLHNKHEQTLGAQACIISTTEVKGEAIRIDARDAIAQGIALTNLKGLYEMQLSTATAGNASLAQRVFDGPVCASPVQHSGSAAAGAQPEQRLPESESPARLRLPTDFHAVLDACDADHARVTAIAAAYNDWRARMIRENPAP